MIMLATALLSCQPAEREAGGSPGERDEGAALPELIATDAGEIQQAIAAHRGHVVLVNVWATWCQPCREEFPDLMQVYRESYDDGLRLVLVCADFAGQTDAARRFLAEQGVDFVSYQKTGKDMEFIDTLDPEWSGALPATWIYDRDGQRRSFWENKATHQELRERVDSVLDR